LVFAAANAWAEKVGVAAAVNPDAFSSLAGKPESQINIGKSIFYNERINTTGSGLVQVLLVDGSTFTVGPGSDLVIDKFVYNPRKGTGEISASFSKGVMRFVGGKLSKNDGGVTVDTPAGALAIRGGIAYLDFKSANNYSILFVFGEYLKNLSLNKTLFEKGYGWFMNNGQFQTREFTTSDLKTILAALTNNSGSFATKATESSKPSTSTLFNTQNLNQLIVDATTEQIVTQAIEAANQPTTNPLPPSCEQLGTCPPPPEPEPVNVRVLTSPGVYDLPGWGYIDNGGEHGILGGGSYAQGATPPLADDFIWTFETLNGRLFGTVTGLTDASCDPDNCASTIENHPVEVDPIVDFPWFEPGDCADGICQITEADNAIVTQGVPRTYTGYAARKDGFFAYQLVGQHPEDGEDRILLFGGEKYSFAETTTGTLYKFELTQDLLESEAFGPFASDASSPIGQTQSGIVTTEGVGTGYVSPLLLLDNGTTESGNGGVWLQTNFFLGKDEDGFNGESFINIALGTWDAETGLFGARGGGSSVAGGNPQDYSFSGDIASLAGPDGEGALSHFMGTQNPNIVVGFDSTGTHNIGRDTPLNPPDGSTVESQSGSTYHVGIGNTGEPAGEVTGGTLKGFAAGLGQHPGDGKPTIIGNLSVKDLVLTLDAQTNSLTASMQLGEGILQNPKYNLEFGGEGQSAFIDNNTFAAIEAEDGSSVSEQYIALKRRFPFFEVKTYTDDDPEFQGYFVSADAIKANEVLFGTDAEGLPIKEAFCHACTFLSWGAWGMRTSYTDHNEQAVTTDVNLGWWIAGDVVQKDDMPFTGTATYAGDAIGTVASLEGDDWVTAVATGDLDMSWNFGKRSGLLTISEFDGKTFGGPMVSPGNATFLGPLTGAGGLIGEANGAFVGSPGAGQMPGGVMGNFGVGSSTWQASGIFGGSLQP
jgi:hypothetical protein